MRTFDFVVSMTVERGEEGECGECGEDG